MRNSIFYDIDTVNNKFSAFATQGNMVRLKKSWDHKMVIGSLEDYKIHSRQIFKIEGFLVEDLNGKNINDVIFPVLIKNSPTEIEIVFENYKG